MYQILELWSQSEQMVLAKLPIIILWAMSALQPLLVQVRSREKDGCRAVSAWFDCYQLLCKLQ